MDLPHKVIFRNTYTVYETPRLTILWPDTENQWNYTWEYVWITGINNILFPQIGVTCGETKLVLYTLLL